MKVEEVVHKIADNYYKIVIEVFDRETNLIKERHFIEPHGTWDKIPKDILEMEIGMITLYYDRLSIAVC